MSEIATATPAVTTVTSTATEEVAHTTWAGRPPCKFTEAPPNHWPLGQGWAPHYDLDAITCPVCKTWAEHHASDERGGM